MLVPQRVITHGVVGWVMSMLSWDPDHIRAHNSKPSQADWQQEWSYSKRSSDKSDNSSYVNIYSHLWSVNSDSFLGLKSMKSIPNWGYKPFFPNSHVGNLQIHGGYSGQVNWWRRDLWSAKTSGLKSSSQTTSAQAIGPCGPSGYQDGVGEGCFFLDVFSLHGNISWHRFITVQEQVGPCVFMCKFLSACFRVFGTVAAQGILGYYR